MRRIIEPNWPPSPNPALHWGNPPPPLVAVSSDVNQRVNKWVVNTADGTDADESHRPPNGVAGRRSTHDQKAEGEQWSGGGDGKFVFSVPRAVKCAWRKTLFVSHTKAPHRAASVGVIAVLSNTNHWNHLPNLLSGCVWQSVVTYHRFLSQGGLGGKKKNANNISHASHIPEINF